MQWMYDSEAPEDNTRYEYEIFERKYITFNKLAKKKKKKKWM